MESLQDRDLYIRSRFAFFGHIFILAFLVPFSIIYLFAEHYIMYLAHIPGYLLSIAGIVALKKYKKTNLSVLLLELSSVISVLGGVALTGGLSSTAIIFIPNIIIALQLIGNRQGLYRSGVVVGLGLIFIFLADHFKWIDISYSHLLFPNYRNFVVIMGGVVLSLIIATMYTRLNFKVISYTDKAKRRAENINRMRSDFYAKITHDIVTPLDGIICYCQLIKEEATTQAIERYSDTIMNEMKLLRSLAGDVMDEVKMTQDKLALYFEVVDVEKLVEDVFNLFAIRARDKNITLIKDVENNIPINIVTDALRLRQILINLVSNAIKFSEKSTVKLMINLIKKTPKECYLRFSVKDSGIGIPKAHQARVLKAFEQGVGDIDPHTMGRGLGLTIVTGLLDILNSRLNLISDEGKGSLFWFDLNLPIVEGAKEAELDSDNTESTNDKNEEEKNVSVRNEEEKNEVPELRILIVDDYHPNLFLMDKIVAGMGAKATACASGEEAIEKCKEEEFDYIFMDLHMPVIDGIEATRSIRSLDNRNKDVPIYAMSSDDSKQTTDKAQEAGITGFLNKPVDMKKIKSVVKGQKETGESESSNQEVNSIFDESQALEEFCGQEKILHLAIKKFMSALDKQIVNIENYLSSESLEEIFEEAHKIRGGAFNLRANALGESAKRLESLKEASKLDEVRVGFLALKEEKEKLSRFLKNKNIF